MERRGGKPHKLVAPAIKSGSVIAEQSSRTNRKPSNQCTGVDEHVDVPLNLPCPESICAGNEVFNEKNIVPDLLGADLTQYDDMTAIEMNNVVSLQKQLVDLNYDIMDQHEASLCWNLCQHPTRDLYEHYIDYKIICESVGTEPLCYDEWNIMMFEPQRVSEMERRKEVSEGLVQHDPIVLSSPHLHEQNSPVEKEKEVVVVQSVEIEDKELNQYQMPVKKKKVSYRVNINRVERQKNAQRKVFVEEVDRFTNEYVCGEPNKRLSPAFKAQNDSILLEHMFEPQTYCRAVQFLRVPKTFPQEEVRVQKLYPHLANKDYDLMVLKEAFRGVNEVLYELCWFTPVEVVSYKKSNKYLYHFFHNGRQLTHLRATKVTENFRDSDAMTYWIRNYPLFLSIFCGRKTNRFTKRIVEYMNDQGTMYQISQGTSLCSKPPQQKKKLQRGCFKQFSDDRDHSVRGVRSKYIESKDHFEGQMFSPISHAFESLRDSAVSSVGNFMTDAVTSAVRDLPSRIMSSVATALMKGKDMFIVISSFIKQEFERLKSLVVGIFESITDEVRIGAMIVAFSIFLLLLFMYVFRSMFAKCKKVFCLCLCSSLEYLGCDLSKRDIVKITEIFESDYQRQNLSEIAPVIGVALGAALSACSKSDSQTAGAVMNFASRFPQVFSSVEDCISNVFDYLYHWKYGEHYLKDKKLIDEFDEFMHRFRSFCEIPDVELNIDRDISVALVLEELHKSVKVLEPLTMHIRTNPTLSVSLARAFAKVNQLYESHRLTADLYATRIETVLCWLYGHSGQGKTTVLPHIIAGVYELVRSKLPKLLPHDYSPAQVHHRNKLSQYWEGYDRQFACVWNEALEKADLQERARTLSELLTACESGAFPLDMAFDRKGKSFFNSMMALVTSNFDDNLLDRESHMTFPEAIVRRRTMYLEVVRKGDFQTFVSSDGKAIGNFDEAWSFILRRPVVERFDHCFFLGLPKNLHEMLRTNGSVELTFSMVISVLAEEIIKRQSVRQDESEFIRSFSYLDYVKNSSSVPQQYHGPAFVNGTVKKDTKRERRRERRIEPEVDVYKSDVQEGVVVDCKDGEVIYAQTDVPTQSVSEVKVVHRRRRQPPPVPPRVGKKEVFEGQMWTTLKILWNQEGEVPSAPDFTYTFSDQVAQGTDRRWSELRSERYWAESGYNPDSDMSQGTGKMDAYNFGVASIPSSVKQEACDQIKVVSPRFFGNFPELFERYILSSDPRRNRKAECLVRLLYLHYYGHGKLGQDHENYIIHKLKKLGVDGELFFRSPHRLGESEWRELPLYKHKFMNHLLNPFLRNPEILGDHWIGRMHAKIHYFFERHFVASSLPNPKNFVRHFPLSGPWFEAKDSVFGGTHWTCWGSVLSERWSSYLDDTFGAFMRKHSTLVFAAAASVLGIGLAFAIGHVINSEEKAKKELVGIYPDTSAAQIRDNVISRQVNATIAERGNSVAQSYGRGHNHRLPPRAVQVQSASRGHQARLPPRTVQAQSVGRGQKFSLRPRSVVAHATGEPKLEKWLIDSAFAEGSAWVAAAFKLESLIDGRSVIEEFCAKNYSEGVSSSILTVLDEWAVQSEEPSFALLHSLIFDDWTVWPDGEEPAASAVLQFYHQNDEGRQNWLRESRRAGFWDHKLFTLLDDTFVGQSGSSQQIYNFSQHMRTILVEYPDGRKFTSDGILSGSRFFTVAHFFDEHGLDFLNISLVNAKGTLAVAYKEHLVVAPLPYKRDVMYIDFPATALSPFKSLKPKLFKNRQDMEEKLSMDGDFCRLSRTVMPDGSILLERVNRNHIQKGVKPIDQLYLNGRYKDHDHQFYYLMLGGMGQKGDCGQPYLWTDPTGVVYLIGVHTGKTGNNSYFSPLFQEDLSQKFFGQSYFPKYLKIDTPKMSRIVPNEKYLYLGKAAKPKIIPSETKLRPSPAQGDFNREPLYGPPTTVPGILRETWIGDEETGHKATPLKNCKAKLSRAPVRPMHSWFYQFVKHYPEQAFEGFFPAEMDLKNIRLWTIEEALFGIPGVWDGFARDTAVGYDIECAIPNCKTRKDLWDPETGNIHPILRMLVKDLFDAVDRGEQPRHVVAGCLKDETRTLDSEENPRLFMIGALSHQIFTVMCCGSLVTEMKRCRATTDSAIGTNIHSFDWKSIYEKVLSSDKWKFINGDGKNFDTSVCPWAAVFLAEACLPYYGLKPDSREYRWIKAAFLSCVGPILVIVDEVYDLSFANPSGQWLTGFLNTFVNQISFNFFFIRVVELNKEEYPDLQKYTRREALRLVLYGDDNLGAVIEKFQKFINMITYGQFVYDFFGITYTTAQKGLVLPEFVPKEEVEFLARKFRREGGNVKAPLNEESIYSMVYWIREPAKNNPEGNTLDSQFLVNLEQAHQEWYHYGKDRFEIEADKIRELCRELGISYPGKSYEEYSDRWLQAQRD